MRPPPRDTENPNVTEDEEREVMAVTTATLFDVIVQNGAFVSVCENDSVQAVTSPVPMVISPKPSVEPAVRLGPLPQLVRLGVPPDDIAVPSTFDT